MLELRVQCDSLICPRNGIPRPVSELQVIQGVFRMVFLTWLGITLYSKWYPKWYSLTGDGITGSPNDIPTGIPGVVTECMLSQM